MTDAPQFRIRITAVNGATNWLMRVSDPSAELKEGVVSWGRFSSATNVEADAGKWPQDQAELIAKEVEKNWGVVEVVE